MSGVEEGLIAGVALGIAVATGATVGVTIAAGGTLGVRVAAGAIVGASAGAAVGEGACPKVVRTKRREQQLVRMVVFISVLCLGMRRGRFSDSTFCRK